MGVKLPLLLLGAVGTVFLTSCTTLENRRDLYCPANYYAYGPYTRMLHEGIPTYHTVFVRKETTTTTTTVTTDASNFKDVVGK